MLRAACCLALVVALALSGVLAQDCKSAILSPTGESYNIAALIGQVAQATVSGTGYKISICADDITKCGLCDKAGFCEIEEWYDNCVGKFSKATGMSNGQGVELAYPDGEFGRAGVVQLLCKPGAGNIANVRIENDGNLALIDSSVACPGGGGVAGAVSPGGIILLILLIGSVVYLVGGAAFMRFARGAEIGIDLVPNKDFWTVIPGLVLEGALFTFGTIKGLIARVTGGGSS